jgi:DNA modification methylase
VEKLKLLKVDTIYNESVFDFLPKLEDESIDLIICDGPYGVTNHEWDKVSNIQEFNLELIKKLSRVMKKGAALYLFGKSDCIDFIDYRKYLTLQSKIVWYQPAGLAQGRKKYTNNYDIIAYFTLGAPKTFNLDAIRVKQLVELEHRKRCEAVPSVIDGKYNKLKFNEQGKNPGDVWGDIKQLTYKSRELVSESLHVIQKPKALMERLIKASSNVGDTVLDIFSGTGTACVVCKEHKRNYIGVEKNSEYVELANKRLRECQVRMF